MAKTLTIQKRIYLAVMAMMAMTIISVIVAISGFYHAQQAMQQAGQVHLRTVKAASALQAITRQLVADVRYLEGRRNLFELDAVSFDLYQDLAQLNNIVTELKSLGIAAGTASDILQHGQTVRDAVDSTNVHLRRTSALLDKIGESERTLRALELEIAAMDKSGQGVLAGEARSLLFLLQAATGIASEHDLQTIQNRFNHRFPAWQDTVADQMQWLNIKQQLQELGVGSNSLFELRFQLLVLQYGFESIVAINIAKLEPVILQADALYHSILQQAQLAAAGHTDHNRYFIAIFVTLALISVIVGFSLLEHLRAQVVNRIVKLQKNMHGHLDGAGPVATPSASADELSAMGQDLDVFVQKINRRTQELQALSLLGQDLSSAKEYEAIFQKLNEHASSLVKADTIVIASWDAGQRSFSFPTQFEASNELVPHASLIPLSERIICALGEQKQELCFLSHPSLARYLEECIDKPLPEQLRSFLYFPLLDHKNNFVGCFTLAGRTANAFTDNQIDAIRTLSRYIAIALDHAETVKQLHLTQQQLFMFEKMLGIGALNSSSIEQVLGYSHEMKLTTRKLLQHEAELQEFIDDNNLRQHMSQDEYDDMSMRIKRMAKSLKLLDDTSHSIHRFFQEVFTFSEIDEEQQSVSIQALLQQAIALVGGKFVNIEFVQEYGSDLKQPCYAHNLMQAFTDVLLNAAMSIRQGQKNASEAVAGVIKVQTTLTSMEFGITITDNGLTLTASQLQNIFAPTTNQGLGPAGRLSLAQANRAIQLHHGKISAQANATAGTRVHISLPVSVALGVS